MKLVIKDVIYIYFNFLIFYKIGKTKQFNNNRFKQYPKGTIILFQGICLDCDKSEKELISLFKTNYEQCNCTSAGTEYFKGNYKLMINDINTYIFNTSTIIDNNPKPIIEDFKVSHHVHNG